MQNASNALSTYDSLLWQSEMGVDLCVETSPQTLKAVEPRAAGAPLPFAGEEAARNTPQQTTQERSSTPTRGEPPSQPQGLSSITAAVAEARELANNANTLQELESAIRAFNGCALKKTATNTVFAQGVPESRLMFIGEAPGADEDRNGVPFCGASGQLLDKMLSFIGLKRSENFYITNTLFWRPPGNRQPTAEELEICRPFVEKHIALVNPKILITVGGTATSSILKDSRGITRLRGQVFRYKNDYMADEIPVHVIYHPSYLLRQPLAKKQAWADLLALKQALTAA